MCKYKSTLSRTKVFRHQVKASCSRTERIQACTIVLLLIVVTLDDLWKQAVHVHLGEVEEFKRQKLLKQKIDTLEWKLQSC